MVEMKRFSGENKSDVRTHDISVCSDDSAVRTSAAGMRRSLTSVASVCGPFELDSLLLFKPYRLPYAHCRGRCTPES